MNEKSKASKGTKAVADKKNADKVTSSAPDAQQQATQGQAAQGQQAPQPTQMENDAAAVVGKVAWLLMDSPQHKYLFISDLDWLIKPALFQNQYRLYEDQNRPLALVLWARMSEEVEQRFLTQTRKLQPGDWNSGDRLWLIEVIAPYGGQDGIITDLQNVFKGQEMKLIQMQPNGQPSVAKLSELVMLGTPPGTAPSDSDSKGKVSV